MRLDLLAPSSPTAPVLHIVHEIDWAATPLEFRPLCRWSQVWPTSGWSSLVRLETPDLERDGRRVCERCLQSARWRVDMLTEQFEQIAAYSAAVSSTR